MRDWLFIKTNDGKSMAQIAHEVCADTGIKFAALRGATIARRVLAARQEFYRRTMEERPDLSTEEIGNFINRDGSTIRHFRRRMEAA